METVFLSLGSNLGIKRNNLEKALSILKNNERIKIIKSSSFYLSEPVEMTKQPYFVNQVVKIKTDYSPKELLNYVLETEKAMGRRRDIPKGPRLIDIDILTYGKIEINEKYLIIPHPEMKRRNFVLVPLLEIEPDYYFNEMDKPLSDYLNQAHLYGSIKKISAGGS